MAESVNKKLFLQVLLLLLSNIILLQQEIYAQLGLQQPQPKRTVRLFESDKTGFTLFAEDSLLFRLPPIKFKRTVTLDSSAEFISISEYMDDSEFALPSVVDLENYIKLRIYLKHF